MSTVNHSHLYLARFTLENRTALSIATGFSDGTFDTQLIRDANDLPTLPGTALAGTLRHLYQREHGQQSAEQLFGKQDRAEGVASRVHLSWGVMLDSHGKALQGIEFNNHHLTRDPLLGYALKSKQQPTVRDRVRLNHRGVAAGEAKFDRAILPPGFRFAIELTLWGEETDEANWNNLLALLNHPLFRLGANTRSGLGAMQLVSLHQQHFDLKEPAAAHDYQNLPADIDNTHGLSPYTPEPSGQIIRADIILTPLSFWRVGQGDSSLSAQQDPARKPADLLPKLEPKVIWGQNGTQADLISHTLLVPGAGVKGALSHRIAFHHNRLNIKTHHAEALLSNEQRDYDHRENPAVIELFGSINNSNGGQVGKLLIDDFTSDVTTSDLTTMMHNAIDRFTGGVRERMLFEEELVWNKPIEITLRIDTHASISAAARQALAWALNDLTSSRLAIGAGASKGHGYFSGSITWSDNGEWIGELESEENAA